MRIRSCIVAGSFAAALAAVAIVNAAVPQKEFSETENRYLQTLPAPHLHDLASGRFSSAFEAYTTDQFWNRDGWVGLKTMVQIAMLHPDNGRAYFGRDGYLFEKLPAYDSRLVGTNCEATAAFLRQAAVLRPDIRPQVMLVPTAAAILPEKLPPLAPVPDQAAVIERMRQAVGDAVLADPTGGLRAGAEHGLFYRTDHHWTTAGAYVGYAELMRARGQEPLPESAFVKETVSDAFYGTVYSKANRYTVAPDRIERWTPKKETGACAVSWEGGRLDSLYDHSYLAQKDKYRYFLGGNPPLARVTTGVKNGQTLLLLKDSYANALVPFLAQHYETILLVDLRYYSASLRPLLEEAGDLLVLYNVSGFASEKTIAANLPDALRE